MTIWPTECSIVGCRSETHFLAMIQFTVDRRATYTWSRYL